MQINATITSRKRLRLSRLYPQIYPLFKEKVKKIIAAYAVPVTKKGFRKRLPLLII